jgi:putative ABC transport system permease protein
MPIRQDLRQSVRLLINEPRFSLAALLTLALAIGATTTLFSVIDAALLRAVPYPHPEQLATILINENPADESHRSFPALNEVRAWQASLGSHIQQTCLWRTWSPEVIDTGEFDRVLIRRWSEGCLDLYGLKPAIGRGFTVEDTRIGAPPVAMLGYTYWQQRYASSPTALGQSINFGDTVATIVGVVPASQDRTTAVFVPLRSRTLDDEERRGRGTETIVRLRPGVTLRQAESAIDGMLKGDTSRGGGRAEASALYDGTTRGFGTTIRTLSYAVGLILLLACVNVGGLLLARGKTRQMELAIRASLGASRGRLVAQLLTESVVLALASAALGVAVAWATLGTVVALVPLSLPADAPVTLNLKVLGWTTLAACGTALLFGLAPALRLTRRAAEHAIARTSRRGGSPLTRRTGQLLVAAEVALAMVLVAGAGVMVRSLARLLAADLGLDTSHVVSMHVVPSDLKPEVLTSYFPALWRSVRDVPGVAAAGAIDHLPLIGGATMGAMKVADKFEMVETARILPGYFEATGIRLVAGRLPTEADLHAPVVVMSEDGAAKFFGPAGWIGRRVSLAGRKLREVEVIGVVRTVQHWGAGTTFGRPKVYSLFGEDESPQPMTIVLRMRPGVPLPADELRRVANALGPRVFVEKFQPGSAWVSENTITARHRTQLFALLGGFGLLLALAGVFSMTAYAVASRTQEIGVRMALGARPGQMVAHVLRDAAWPIVLGTVAGGLGAVLATRLIAAFLYNTQPTDGATYAAVAAALIVAGCIAAWLPARHAARVDPARALRAD